MSDEFVLREEPQPGVVRLTFNRPGKMNALSTPMLRELEAHLDALAQDASARAIILAGAGEKAFVAGADIAEYRGNRTAEFVTYQLESRRIFDKLEALPKPTVAAIRGYALGGGFEIALCCDIIICATSARLGLPEGLLGLSPGGGGTQRLTRAVGRYVASDMMLAARRITGERAFQLGLAAECVADDALTETSIKRAQSIRTVAPLAQAEMKRLIRQGPDAPLPVAQSLEQEVLFRLYGSQDAQEGVAAFLDKRSPQFKGQ
jgi:enoyl-CoA hydratase